MRHVLGEEFQLSHATAHINTTARSPAGADRQQAQFGERPQAYLWAILSRVFVTTGDLSMDQWWLPQPVAKAQIAPSIRPGSITPSLVHDANVASHSQDVIAPAVTLDVLWALSPFAASVCPGSHKAGRHPTEAEGADGGGATVGAGTFRHATVKQCIAMFRCL